MNDRHWAFLEGFDIIENIIQRLQLDFSTILIGNSSFLLEFVVRRFDSHPKKEPIQIDGIEVTKVCIVIHFSIYNIYFRRN